MRGKEEEERKAGGELSLGQLYITSVMVTEEETYTRLLRPTDDRARKGNGVTSDPTWK